MPTSTVISDYIIHNVLPVFCVICCKTTKSLTAIVFYPTAPKKNPDLFIIFVRSQPHQNRLRRPPLDISTFFWAWVCGGGGWHQQQKKKSPFPSSKPHPKACLHLIPTSAAEGRVCFKAQRQFWGEAERRENVSQGKWINSGRTSPEAETLLLIVRAISQSIDTLPEPL